MILKYFNLRFYIPLKKFFSIRINLICISIIFGVISFINGNYLIIFFAIVFLFLELGFKKILLFTLISLSAYFYTNSIPTIPITNTAGTFTATIIYEPIQKEFNKELIFQIDGSPNLSKATVDKYLEVGIYDKIIFNGKISEIINTKGSNFDNKSYLLSKRITGEVKNMSILKIINTQNTFTYISELKHNLELKIDSSLSEPDSSLTNGILFGNDTNLNEELQNDLKNSGIYHIISVSGFNVGIIFSFIYLCLSKFIQRRKRILISLFAVFVFMIFIGLNNIPVIRATLMIFFIYLGLYFGRKVSAVSALLLSSTILILIYPYYILNLSFLLSTFATFGIVILGKFALEIDLFSFGKNFIDNLKSSLYAISSTSIITYLSFKEINATGLITNIFILPFIPLLMSVALLILIFKILGINLMLYVVQIFLSTFYKIVYFVIDFISNNILIKTNNILLLLMPFLFIILFDYQKFKKNTLTN